MLKPTSRILGVVSGDSSIPESGPASQANSIRFVVLAHEEFAVSIFNSCSATLVAADVRCGIRVGKSGSIALS
jgi:hypothetical protein